MKATEIIETLQKLVDEHGDGDVQMVIHPDQGVAYFSPIYEIYYDKNRLYPFLFSGEVHSGKDAELLESLATSLSEHLANLGSTN